MKDLLSHWKSSFDSCKSLILNLLLSDENKEERNESIRSSKNNNVLWTEGIETYIPMKGH